jgi:putative membrane protein
MALVLFTATVGTAQTGRDTATQQSANDSGFAQKAAASGQMEVKLSQDAAAKATSPDVKAYANRLVKDHTAANQELMALMKNKQMTVGALSGMDKPEPFQSKTGAEFDRGFIDHAIDHHKSDIALFESEAKSGANAELKAFAAKTLPTLREHLKMAQDLRAKLQSSPKQ